jgi:hypothetical protein
MSDVTNKQQIAGYDTPSLVTPTHADSVKAISFQLSDLDITTEMNEMPTFYAAALGQLGAADGVIELVWRLSDFGMHNALQTVTDNSGQTASTYNGSQGIGGWASLFQFSVKDVSDDADVGADRHTVAIDNGIRGRCNQKQTVSSGTNLDTSGQLLHGSNATNCTNKGFWPVELNVMRGIVTQQDGGVFNTLPTLSDSTSAAEHYVNFVGKEITGAGSGAQLFDNVPEMIGHLINERAATDYTDIDGETEIDGVQNKIWKKIHTHLCDVDNSGASANNIATKLVKYMLDPNTGNSDVTRESLRNRFFADGAVGDADPSGATDVTFERFGPSGGDYKGVMADVDFSPSDYSVWVDVPLSHGDVLEFNLTMKGATNTPGGDATEATNADSAGVVGTTAATDATGSDGTNATDGSNAHSRFQSGEVTTQTAVSEGAATVGNETAVDARFGTRLPGQNNISQVVYRVRIHLEGVDTRPSA